LNFELGTSLQLVPAGEEEKVF
jgi:hypothetical protein